jgi:hypothetical protein
MLFKKIFLISLPREECQVQSTSTARQVLSEVAKLSKGGPVYHAEMTLYWATGPNGEKYVAKRIRVFRDENGVSTEITP